MKCPVCKDIDLVMSERQGVEIDYCPDFRIIIFNTVFQFRK